MISLPHVSGRRFLVLGYAKSGSAAAAALKDGGAELLVWDDSEAARSRAARDGFALADPNTLDTKDLDGLIVAPGVPLTHPAPHPLIAKARANGTPVLSDIDFLYEACPKATYVGITGTNGKSTTTALVAHILSQAGRTVQMGGNIGTPALSLEPLGPGGLYVLEMSSYQLDLLNRNPFSVAAWLNVTPDHLDRHGDMAGYIAAKTKIIRTDTPQTLILGTDEPEMQTTRNECATIPSLTLEEVSATHDVVQGIRIIDQKLYIRNDPQPLDLAPFTSLPGTHNAQNAAVAFAVCRALGLTRREIEAGLTSFPGLAHRQQLVAEIDGVRFINDSKATNADATSKALACYDTVYWIIGGKPKAGGLHGLEPFASRIVHAYLIGAASDEFATWCANQNIPFTPCGTLDVAVEKAASTAWQEKKKDAAVLLSPACASFDQFTSFEQRGEHFVSLINNFQRKE